MSGALYLNALGAVCALGAGKEAVARALFAGESGLVESAEYGTPQAIPVGIVPTPLPSLEGHRVGLRGRNNQLAAIAAGEIRAEVETAIERYGADRVAVIVGTSTSGIGESEGAVCARARTGTWPPGYDLEQQELGTLARFLADELGARGPAYVHASACSSGAKAIASAARLINAGCADAVVTGGVDSLCTFTIAGFGSLNLVSIRRTNPFSKNRDGINIGEAAALFLMTRAPATVRLRGWGESSDGHHFSAPDPTGRGATLAIEQALGRAGAAAADVQYVNLHATGTLANDVMEGAVVNAIFGPEVPSSGTKPLTGHTLGAAGAIEAAFCWLTMQDANREGALPPHLWDGAVDPGIPPIRHVAPGERLGHAPRTTLSTSFAFGGANAALIFGRE